MTYSISDFKTGQDISSPAKLKLWEFIIKRTFGGMDCALRQYEKYSASGSWKSYKINGMISYIDELTDGDYGKTHPEVARVAGTLATQFKVKFPSIHYLMSSNSVLDTQFNIAPPKVIKETKVSSPKKSSEINRQKIHSILADIYSKNLSEEEIKYIGQFLMSS